MNRRRRPRISTRQGPLILAGVCLAAFGPTWLGAQQPKLVTSFSVGEVRVVETLTEEESGLVEDSIGRLIADLGARHFPFLDWTPAGEAPASGSATLRVAIREDSVKPRPDRPACYEFFLTLDGDPADPDIPVVGAIEDVELYALCELWPTTADGLLRDLTRVLTDLFDSETFREDQLHDALLSKIAVADTSLIEVDDGGGRIVMHLSWRRVLPDPNGTRLRLDLVGEPFTRMKLRDPTPSAEEFIVWRPEELNHLDSVITNAMVSTFKLVWQATPGRPMKAFLTEYEQGRPAGGSQSTPDISVDEPAEEDQP